MFEEANYPQKKVLRLSPDFSYFWQINKKPNG